MNVSFRKIDFASSVIKMMLHLLSLLFIATIARATTTASPHRTCPSEQHQFVFRNHTGHHDKTKRYQIGAEVVYRCKRAHGVIFVTPQGKKEQLQLTHDTATCGLNGQWQFRQPVRCSEGRGFYFGKYNESHPIPVLQHPALLICRNTDLSKYSQVQIQKNGLPYSQKGSTIVWVNITASELDEYTNIIIPFQCVHFDKDGGIGKTEKLQILHKKLHHLNKNPRQYKVKLNSGVAIRIPILSQIPLNHKRIHIIKKGSDETVKTFKVDKKNQTHHELIIGFNNVTQAQLGVYEVRIITTRIDVVAYDFKLVENTPYPGLSTGAKVGVGLTVVISCLIIFAALGFIAKKFIQQRRELDSDGQRVMIIDDNDDNDDVFHDPTRAARLQEEIVRSRENSPTSSNNALNEDSTRAKLVPGNNNADKVSLASQNSDCVILDEKNNSVIRQPDA